MDLPLLPLPYTLSCLFLFACFSQAWHARPGRLISYGELKQAWILKLGQGSIEI